MKVFDAISYCKGSTVVRMAATILGPEKFREGLQLYMKRHQYGNTVTRNLWEAWAEVSGVDVPGLMASWTQQMGFPYLRVVDEQWTEAQVTFTLEQQWFLSDGTGGEGEGADKLWSIPLLFVTSSEVSQDAVIMSARRQTFAVAVKGPEDFVKINAGQRALVRVAHSNDMYRRLNRAIGDQTIGPEDRSSLLLDAYSLAKANIVPVEMVVNVLRGFGTELNSTVWSAIEEVLNGLSLIMETIGGVACDEFFRFAGKLVKASLTEVGWEPRPGVVEGHTYKLLRTILLRLAESFCSSDPEVSAEARRRYDLHWEDPSALPSEYKVRQWSP